MTFRTLLTIISLLHCKDNGSFFRGIKLSFLSILLVDWWINLKWNSELSADTSCGLTCLVSQCSAGAWTLLLLAVFLHISLAISLYLCLDTHGSSKSTNCDSSCEISLCINSAFGSDVRPSSISNEMGIQSVYCFYMPLLRLIISPVLYAPWQITRAAFCRLSMDFLCKPLYQWERQQQRCHEKTYIMC